MSSLLFIINLSCCYCVHLIIETKQDRLKKVDPMLLFPMKAWLRGFLPGHKFTWEDDFRDEIDVEKKVKITVSYSSVPDAVV